MKGDCSLSRKIWEVLPRGNLLGRSWVILIIELIWKDTGLQENTELIVLKSLWLRPTHLRLMVEAYVSQTTNKSLKSTLPRTHVTAGHRGSNGGDNN